MHATRILARAVADITSGVGPRHAPPVLKQARNVLTLQDHIVSCLDTTKCVRS